MTSTVQEPALLSWRRVNEFGKVPQQNELSTQPEGLTRTRLLLELLICLVPAVWVGSLVSHYGVNSPWGDQWDGTFPLFAKMQKGTLGFNDFFAFHSEHRILFPSLLSFSLAKITHWNVRAELLVIWLLSCVCAFNVWRIAILTSNRRAPSHLILLFSASMLIFTPLQWENLLWGFQIGFLLPLACMTALPWVAFSFRQPLNFFFLSLLCVVSTFSIASGFAAWFLATGLLVIVNGKPQSNGQLFSWGIWILAASTSIAIYFHGFQRPEWHPNELEALRHPLFALKFVVTYLGFPFCSGIALDAATVASCVGGALLLLLLFALAYLWRWRCDRRLIRCSAAWLALIGIALVNCVLTLIGRAGFGISAAMQSRYVSFAIFLPIGLLFLCTHIFEHWRAARSCHASLRIWTLCTVQIFAGSLGLLLYLGTKDVLPFWAVLQHERLAGKATLLMSNILSEPAALQRYLHPSPSVKEWVSVLNQIDYVRPRAFQSNCIADIARLAPGQLVGRFKMLRSDRDGRLIASGWAILPWKDRVADSVLLTWQNESSEALIFARVDVTELRQDLVEAMGGDDSYSNCGWTKSLTPDQIPTEARQINAWAFDAEEGHAYLIGSTPL